MPETIQISSHGPVLRITLNRPKVLNAINGRMLVEIREALAQATANRNVRVLLFDSACPKAFSSGIDVAYVKDLKAFEVREVGRELHRTFLAIRTTEKPVVAAIDGLCLGAGLELAVSCDFMVATNRSSFGLPNINRGIPAIVEAAILPMAIGIQKAREMALTGEFWDAGKAERFGLLHAVVPPSELENTVQGLCQKLAKNSPLAMATQKEIIHKWMTTDLEAAIDFSINTVVLNFMTRDQKEGMQSFLEKRRPDFSGE